MTTEPDLHWKKSANAASLVNSVQFIGKLNDKVLRWHCASSKEEADSYTISRIENPESLMGCDWHCTCRNFEIECQNHVNYECKHIYAVQMALVTDRVYQIADVPIAKKEEQEWVSLTSIMGVLQASFDATDENEVLLINRLRHLIKNKNTVSLLVNLKLADIQEVTHNLNNSLPTSYQELSIKFNYGDMALGELIDKRRDR